MSRLPDHLNPPAIIETITRYECPKCGNNCSCGVPYVPKTVRAAEYAAQNPTASIREIAKETGVGHGTAQEAKKRTESVHLDEVVTVGLDAKSYPAAKPPAPKPKRRFPSAEGDDATRKQIVGLFSTLSWNGCVMTIRELGQLLTSWGVSGR